MSSNKKVIVIGAGPAGLTAAYELAKKGTKVTVIESTGSVGGMAKSFELFGQIVDCGPHRFFSSDKIVNDLFHEVVQDDYTLVNRLTRIYYKNKFFDYPLKLGNVLKNLSPIEIFQILWSYAIQRIIGKKNLETFEDWVTDKFGKKLFQMFFKTYSEKLWGITCDKIDSDWAAQRIKKLSLYEAVKAAIFGNKGNKHKTLVDQFAYPKNGTGEVYEKMATAILKMGGEILFNKRISEIEVDNDKVVHSMTDDSGIKYTADIVISTMPLTLLLKGMTVIDQNILEISKKLYFRNTTLVYLEIDSDKLFPDNWIYIHSPEVKHGRITNFRNWCTSINKDKNTTILCLEFWSFDHEELWGYSDEKLIEMAEREIRTLKLIETSSNVLNSAVVRIPKCYPVYETGYMENLQPVIDYLKEFKNLYPIGRYGSFKYNNQDHSILMGILIAKQIESGKDQNLWSINTDSDYQEQTEINLTGYNT
jgi:protoporphyrinogen oxidase